jgi:hypothetical protein
MKNECPVQGKCLQSWVIYQSTVTREDDRADTYIGLSEPPFKDRLSKHKSNFKTRNPKNSTTLSKHIWKLQDQTNVQFLVGIFEGPTVGTYRGVESSALFRKIVVVILESGFF